jgi:hypothetical protein
MSVYKLYYIDSKGEKRYLHRCEIEAYEDVRDAGVWETNSQDVVLRRRWAEARQGMLYQIEGNIDPEREEFVNQWCEIHQ